MKIETQKIPPRLSRRGYFPRALSSLAAIAALGIAAVANAQTPLVSDDFNATSLNTGKWANGSTHSLGLTTFANGSITLDTHQQTTARNSLLSHATNINPFTGELTISLDGLSLAGVPAGNPISLVAVVGRLPADTGGAATATLAEAYTTGGGVYYTNGGTGGALGLSILRYGSGSVQLQVLDSGGVNGTGSYANALGSNRVLSAVPAKIVWTINGQSSSFTITLTGATFTTGAEAGTGTITGTFSRFTAATLGASPIARFAMGSFNTGTGITDGGAATFDHVSVTSSLPSGPPTMMGVNLAGAEFGDTFPGTYNQHYVYPGVAQLDYYKARGIELIRMPFKWERLQHTLNGPLNAAELARIDTFLNLVEQRGMRVILDMHNYARYRISGTPYIIGSPEVPRSAYADVWSKLAAHVKDRDCIWAYGIMNEPYNMGTYTWKDSAQVAVNAIRAHDMRHTILLPGDAYSGAHWWLTHGANLITITDPANNVMFEAHQYFDNDSSGKYVGTYDTEGATPTSGIASLTNFVNWCKANNVRGFVGEYGVPDNDPRWITTLDNTLGYLASNNISGTYWAGGPWWGSYVLSSEMRRLGEEAPQMAALIARGSGVGTRYWPPYVWYKDAVSSSPSGSYTYNYKSTTATLAVDFDDATSAYSAYDGARGIRFSYTVPSGGWAGAGMHLNGGVNLAPNFQRNHVLTFYIKGTAGSSVRVFFRDLNGVTSAKVNTASYVTTSGSWQQVRIPLSQFLTSSFTGTSRADRLAFEGLPIDNTARVIQLDQFAIEKPESVSPTATVATSGGSSFAANAAFTANATASDASGIDFVEFLINGERVAIDETAPYSAAISIPAAGQHRLTAIAYDLHGNPGRSSVQTLTITP